jgi:hypothetical protein
MMTSVGAVRAEAFDLLRQDLYAYLDESESLVENLETSGNEVIASAGKLIPDLTTVIRGVLADHKNDEAGKCHACQAEWPCQSVRTIHALVTDPEREFLNIVERGRERDGRR